MFQKSSRRAVAPPTAEPAVPRREYLPSAEKNLAVAPIMGTIVTTQSSATQCQGRQFFDLKKPAIVVLHGARSNPQVGSLQAYFTPDAPASIFSSSISRLPLFSSRVAYLWSAGRWVLDVQLDLTAIMATQNVDFDRFDVEDPVVAAAWLANITQPAFSGRPLLMADKAVTNVNSQQVSLAQMLNARAVILQNTGAAAIRVGFDAGATGLATPVPAAATGLPLAAGEKIVLAGSTMPTCDIWAGAFAANSTLSATLFPWSWTLSV